MSSSAGRWSGSSGDSDEGPPSASASPVARGRSACRRGRCGGQRRGRWGAAPQRPRRCPPHRPRRQAERPRGAGDTKALMEDLGIAVATGPRPPSCRAGHHRGGVEEKPGRSTSGTLRFDLPPNAAAGRASAPRGHTYADAGGCSGTAASRTLVHLPAARSSRGSGERMRRRGASCSRTSARGASLAATRGGRCLETTMGFTPTSG